MDLPTFALDQWLSHYDFAEPPIAFNLASSTGPRWSVGEIARLGPEPLALDDLVLSYAPPQGAEALRGAVASFHAVDPDCVVMTTGASEALSILLCLASRPGGNVVIPDPAYPAYAAIAQTLGLAVRAYPLVHEQGFAHRAEAILAATDRDTVAVIVNTPHNPTGAVMAHAEIAALGEALAARSVLLMVDEVYHPLHFGEPRRSAAGLRGVTVISDLSKAFSLPGLRTGWIVAASPDQVPAMINARSYFTISSSPLSEGLATHALAHREVILARLADVAGANRARLTALIENASSVLEWAPPQGGTTSFPRFRDSRDSRPFCEALARAGVLVAPGDCFGQSAHMRIGFAQQADGFDEAIARIRAVLGET